MDSHLVKLFFVTFIFSRGVRIAFFIRKKKKKKKKKNVSLTWVEKRGFI